MQRLRRWILRKIVPEAVWPVHAQLDRVLIPVRGMPFSFGVKRILCDGTYEVSELRLMNEAIRPGVNIHELGGSIGILATIAAEKVGATGAVISVEAAARLTRHSASRLAKYGNVRIVTGLGFPVTVAPDKARGGLFRDTGNSLGRRVRFDEVSAGAEDQHAIYDIARIIRDYKFEPSVLLVDIEGSEEVLLEPGAAIPACVTRIIIELHPGLYGEDAERRIVKSIESFGFTMAKEISHVYLLTRMPSDAAQTS